MTASWLGAVLASNVFRRAEGPWSRRDSQLQLTKHCRLSSSLQLLPDLEIVLSFRITVDRPLDLLERIVDSYLFHF